MGKDINRLKVMLTQQSGKAPATVSKWYTNTAQPSLGTLSGFAHCLKADVRALLHCNILFDMASEPYVSYIIKDGTL